MVKSREQKVKSSEKMTPLDDLTDLNQHNVNIDTCITSVKSMFIQNGAKVMTSQGGRPNTSDAFGPFIGRMRLEDVSRYDLNVRKLKVVKA